LLCLGRLKELHIDFSPIFNLALGNNKFIRPFSIFLLWEKRHVHETTLARVLPETLVEIELFLRISFLESHRGYLEAIFQKIESELPYNLALCSILNCCIRSTISKGFNTYQKYNLDIATKESLEYYVAENLIRYHQEEQNANATIKQYITFLISITQANLAKELFKLARFALILPDTGELLYLKDEN
jgi:hypothetical protein